MLSREENELLTRVGPGTPTGELFRRFWLPVLLSEELATRGRRPGARAHPRGRSRRVSGHARRGWLAGAQLPAPRRVAVLRPQRGGRPAVRVPRVEVRRGGGLRRYSQRKLFPGGDPGGGRRPGAGG